MNLKHLTDNQLNLDLKNLVQNERELLTQILHHLKEIETRKLFSTYGYTSLFDYACKELKYSSDQAYRRIQAMRLLKDIPEAASKINSGELTLSNISQAQKFFKDTKTITKPEKIKVLKKLMNKSVREAQKELLKLNPISFLPEETKKQVTPTYTYVGFNMSQELETKLEDIKALLGPKVYKDGRMLSLAELIELMADLAKERLTEKKFGKRRVQADKGLVLNSNSSSQQANKKEMKSHEVLCFEKTTLDVQRRYVSKSLKYKLWKKAEGQCEKCKSQINLQIDHRQPLALQDETKENNLRVLCFNCNQRARIVAGL